MTTKQTRICVIGDELVAGVGDPKALGWLGRVAARTNTSGTISIYSLAVPQESTNHLAQRWEQEFRRRFTDHQEIDYRLVVALGAQDIRDNISMARSRLNLANILDKASNMQLRPFVVGPPPAPLRHHVEIAELSAAFYDVCLRRKIPYVDTFTPLLNHEQWRADFAVTDEEYPSQAGYGLMAWLVLHTGWRSWLGLPEEFQQ